MSSLAVTNTLVDGTTITAAQHNTNYSDIVTYINNRNSGSSSWEALSTSGNLSVTGTSTLTGAVTASSTIAVTGVLSAAAQILMANGTAAAPSLSFTSDTDTGITRIGANRLGLITAGIEHWEVTAAGDLSVVNSEILFVADGAVTAPGIAFSADPDTGVYRIGGNNLAVAVGGTKFVDAKTAQGFSILGSDGTASAAIGFVGEYTSSSVTSTSSLGTSTQFANITNITLSAGDWDVTGCAFFDANGATVTSAYATAVSINTGNTTTDHVDGDNVLYGTPAALSKHASTTVHYRLIVTTSTVVYLKAAATYSGAVPKMAGTIKARRVR